MILLVSLFDEGSKDLFAASRDMGIVGLHIVFFQWNNLMGRSNGCFVFIEISEVADVESLFSKWVAAFLQNVVHIIGQIVDVD